MVQQIRLKVADVLSWLYPLSCWASLASWAVGNVARQDIELRGRCHREAGGCYCGKFGLPELAKNGE